MAGQTSFMVNAGLPRWRWKLLENCFPEGSWSDLVILCGCLLLQVEGERVTVCYRMDEMRKWKERDRGLADIKGLMARMLIRRKILWLCLHFSPSCLRHSSILEDHLIKPQRHLCICLDLLYWRQSRVIMWPWEVQFLASIIEQRQILTRCSNDLT